MSPMRAFQRNQTATITTRALMKELTSTSTPRTITYETDPTSIATGNTWVKSLKNVLQQQHEDGLLDVDQNGLEQRFGDLAPNTTTRLQYLEGEVARMGREIGRLEEFEREVARMGIEIGRLKAFEGEAGRLKSFEAENKTLRATIASKDAAIEAKTTEEGNLLDHGKRLWVAFKEQFNQSASLGIRKADILDISDEEAEGLRDKTGSLKAEVIKRFSNKLCAQAIEWRDELQKQRQENSEVDQRCKDLEQKLRAADDIIKPVAVLVDDMEKKITRLEEEKWVLSLLAHITRGHD